ncbi:MAG: hypothetical protein OER87_15840 [Gammaproteobacteria bacterium]|nr:hypothetical protein [Gammaproteobacteria bacterium]
MNVTETTIGAKKFPITGFPWRHRARWFLSIGMAQGWRQELYFATWWCIVAFVETPGITFRYYDPDKSDHRHPEKRIAQAGY